MKYPCEHGVIRFCRICEERAAPPRPEFRVLSRINDSIAFARSIDPLKQSEKVQCAIYAYRQMHRWVRQEFGITKRTDELV